MPDATTGLPVYRRSRNCLELRNPAVTGAIVGARNARQAEGVMRAGELHLSDEELTEIETLLIGTAA